MEVPPLQASRKRRALVVAAVIIAVVIVGFVAYWFFLRPTGLPWLFKGAYAKYYGETTVLITIKLDVQLEVVDYNSTHAKLLEYVKVDTPLGSQESQNVTWVDLTKKSYEVEGWTLETTYEQEVYLEDFGTRKCVIYEYESTSTPGTLMKMYVDKETVWPVKMTFTTEATETIPGMSIDLTITESNIPGLKK